MDNLTAAKPCKVSVLIVSYNHEKYIAEAMDSILAQQVDYPIEIVVADDCSSDQTMEIIRSYQAEHPDLIRVLDGAGNLGITRNYQRGFAACAGEYIAVLEGDDYWLGKNRLSTLVDFLDAHHECVLAFNRILLMEDTVQYCQPLQWDSTRPFELKMGAELAFTNFIGNFSACVFRSSMVRKLEPSLYDQKMYDWLFNMSLSRFGLLGYVPQILSVYRQHAGGTWSSSTMEQKLNETIGLIPVYNEYLHGIYAPQFQAHARDARLAIVYTHQAQLQEKYRGNAFVRLYVLAWKVLLRMRLKLSSLLNR